MTDVENKGAGPTGVERRRPRTGDQSTIGILTHMPALVVLDRIPVPVLAVDDAGVIVFANRTFGDMVGIPATTLVGAPFRSLLLGPEEGPAAGADLAAFAGSVLQFRHAEDWPVRAKMSESALLRGDDAGYLVAFEDITEQTWEKHSSD